MQENEKIVENLRGVFARNTAAARQERRKAAFLFTTLLMFGGLIALVWSWARC